MGLILSHGTTYGFKKDVKEQKSEGGTARLLGCCVLEYVFASDGTGTWLSERQQRRPAIQREYRDTGTFRIPSWRAGH